MGGGAANPSSAVAAAAIVALAIVTGLVVYWCSDEARAWLLEEGVFWEEEVWREGGRGSVGEAVEGERMEEDAEREVEERPTTPDASRTRANSPSLFCEVWRK